MYVGFLFIKGHYAACFDTFPRDSGTHADTFSFTMAVDLEKFLRFSRKIEGDVRNLPIFAIAALGETQCIFRVMVGDVPLERGCGFITAAFCLNGNDLRSVLQNKINFAVLVASLFNG